MNVSQVDDKTVNVVMTTSFRAHFAQPISWLGAAATTGQGLAVSMHFEPSSRPLLLI